MSMKALKLYRDGWKVENPLRRLPGTPKRWEVTMLSADGSRKEVCVLDENEFPKLCPKSGDWVFEDTKHSPYHTVPIPRGELGEFSKIEEEFFEAKDALAQNNKLMLLIELSDMVGSMIHYMEAKYPEIGFSGLVKMAELTRNVCEKRKKGE